MVSENSWQLSNRDCNQLRLAKNSSLSRNRNLPKKSENRSDLKKVSKIHPLFSDINIIDNIMLVVA